MSDEPAHGKLQKKLEKLGIPRIRRHILLCCDTDECGCASRSEMKDAWKHLKKRLRELKATAAGGVFRSKSQCLDVCKAGPIAVVYPEGTWYGWCTPNNLDRIVEEHLLEGRIVEELVLARPPVDGAVRPAPSPVT